MIWLALLIAPYVSEGLPGILKNFTQATNNPFHITIGEDSFKTVLAFLLVYGLSIGVLLSSQRNYRRGEESGSARWGDVSAIDRKYRQRPISQNKPLTQHVMLGLNAKKHRRNLNTMIVGGSGAGKTRFYAKPNLCQGNTSYFILDPNGYNLGG